MGDDATRRGAGAVATAEHAGEVVRTVDSLGYLRMEEMILLGGLASLNHGAPVTCPALTPLRHLKHRARPSGVAGTDPIVSIQEYYICTPGKTKMEPGNGPLEDYFPLQPTGFQVPC